MNCRRSTFIALALSGLLATILALPRHIAAQTTRPAGRSTTAPASQPAKGNAAINPVPRNENWWKERDEKYNQRAKQGAIDLMFVGDSITQGWEGAGVEEWHDYYGEIKAVNFGISGDRTQHVLWRLQNGNLDGLDKNPPKAVVLMIGTNNSNGDEHTAEEIAEGITTIVKTLREKLPQSKVLLLAIFPRGEPNTIQRAKNAKASELASKVADGKNVHYMDIGKDFMNADGSISKEIMPDGLHLSPRGYEIWGDAIEPKLQELMGVVKSGQ